MITWPSLSTGSICFKPPYRLPMPAAMMTRMGLFISNTSNRFLYVMCLSRFYSSLGPPPMLAT